MLIILTFSGTVYSRQTECYSYHHFWEMHCTSYKCILNVNIYTLLLYRIYRNAFTLNELHKLLFIQAKRIYANSNNSIQRLVWHIRSHAFSFFFLHLLLLPILSSVFQLNSYCLESRFSLDGIKLENHEKSHARENIKPNKKHQAKVYAWIHGEMSTWFLIQLTNYDF